MHLSYTITALDADTVESSTRKYDVPLLVTEEVVQACADSGFAIGWEFADETTVKGRAAPVRLYRPQTNPPGK